MPAVSDASGSQPLNQGPESVSIWSKLDRNFSAARAEGNQVVEADENMFEVSTLAQY